MGYKTFDKWWDESYDDELDVEKRIDIITKILKSFENKSKEELIEIRNDMNSILKHNQEIFKKQLIDNREKFLFVLNELEEIPQLQSENITDFEETNFCRLRCLLQK